MKENPISCLFLSVVFHRDDTLHLTSLPLPPSLRFFESICVGTTMGRGCHLSRDTALSGQEAPWQTGWREIKIDGLLGRRRRGRRKSRMKRLRRWSKGKPQRGRDTMKWRNYTDKTSSSKFRPWFTKVSSPTRSKVGLGETEPMKQTMLWN